MSKNWPPQIDRNSIQSLTLALVNGHGKSKPKRELFSKQKQKVLFLLSLIELNPRNHVSGSTKRSVKDLGHNKMVMHLKNTHACTIVQTDLEIKIP